jgi:FkbM family methyltransferase
LTTIEGDQISVSAIRAIGKSCAVLVLGRESKPRRILRGLASGYRIFVSPSENLGYLVGTAEPHLQRAIKQYVTTGDTAYDIGANMGYVSLSLAKRVGPSGHVIAFEPVPRNVELLRMNIDNNQLLNVQVLDVAASDRRGEAVIRISDNLSTASLIWHKNDASAVELNIKTVAIDDLVEAAGLPQPKFVKIDVEGAEGLALLGMSRTLAAAMPVVFIESSEAGRETTWPLFCKLGYRCKAAITGKWVNAFEEYRHSDFLWLPADRANH